MPSTLPDGAAAPADGVLPEAATAGLGQRPLGFYLHVPFCASRCGYCDFNTYTATELGGGGAQAAYADNAVAEVRFARDVLGSADVPVSTVFFGGGTPTLLPPGDLERMLRAVRDEFGLAAGAEVTTEANPESVDEPGLQRLRAAGFTRISFGMQSAVEHVLATLDRQHTPGAAVEAVAMARSAGFDDVSVDLIYGTPGESDADWKASLDAALSAQPSHVSAYSLIVEEGTRLAARVSRGELPAPDEDVLADRYLMADDTLSAAGLEWYELSNWGAPCRHNLGYWRSDDWWGVGPGAHSHVGGVRWWNVKHPTAYAARLSLGRSPAYAREVLGPQEQRLERIALGVRLATGLDLAGFEPSVAREAEQVAAEGLATVVHVSGGDRLVLTRRGRLLADAVTRRLAA